MHRLDLSVSKIKITEKGHKKQWTLSIYNVYHHVNPSFFTIRKNEQFIFRTGSKAELIGISPEAIRSSLFGILPAVSYSFTPRFKQS